MREVEICHCCAYRATHGGVSVVGGAVLRQSFCEAHYNLTFNPEENYRLRLEALKRRDRAAILESSNEREDDDSACDYSVHSDGCQHEGGNRLSVGEQRESEVQREAVEGSAPAGTGDPAGPTLPGQVV